MTWKINLTQTNDFIMETWRPERLSNLPKVIEQVLESELELNFNSGFLYKISSRIYDLWFPSIFLPGKNPFGFYSFTEKKLFIEDLLCLELWINMLLTSRGLHTRKVGRIVQSSGELKPNARYGCGVRSLRGRPC